MDADEERNFAALLSQSAALPSRPRWSPPVSANNISVDPWANPFASGSPTNPFASTAQPFAQASASAYLPSAAAYPEYAVPEPALSPDVDGGSSPYVLKLEEEQVIPQPELPSVIAARERAQDGFEDAEHVNGVQAGTYTTPVPAWDTGVGATTGAGYDAPNGSAYRSSSSPPPPLPAPKPTSPARPKGRILPSDLIDEDLMAASDPSISLKKAFVKTAPAARTGTPEKKQGAYVFRPAGREATKPKESSVQAESVSKRTEEARKEGEDTAGVATAPEAKQATEAEEVGKTTINDASESAESVSAADTPAATATAANAASPADAQNGVPEGSPTQTGEGDAQRSSDENAAPTPIRALTLTPKRESSPAPAPASVPLPDSVAPTRAATPLPPVPAASPPIPAQTPTRDRVAVSPLEPPASVVGDDFGFRSLAIGGSSMPEAETDGWGATATTTMTTGNGSRFGTRGWGVVDTEDDGLFGAGGPARDPWGGGGGWGEAQPVAGPSSPPAPVAEPVASPKPEATPSSSPAKARRRHPVFTISISDPARVGDPVRGYTVYTIRTRTTSPHYRKSEFTSLRRFSDFLWLFDSLIANNPGIIVPPVPDKHTFGRFQEQFIETRRHALERSLNKITSHPVLQLDPDLRLFLESDNFAVESKSRRPDLPDPAYAPPTKSGLLGWSPSAPRFIESDDWFTSRTAFLDSLEAQLKSLSKAIDVASRARLDMAQSYAEVGTALSALADSDLGSAMCAALARLADLAQREKEGAEELAKGDVVNLLNMADEYVRFVGSVRRAMGGRVKVWFAWQGLDKEVLRLKANREKLRMAGKLGDRASQTLAEINDVDRRARETKVEFDTQTKLVKSEFARFERERVDEFKRVLERYLEEQIAKQRELIMAWEEYHAGVLGMVKKAQGIREGQQARP